MATEAEDLHRLEVLLENVRDLVASDDPLTRIAGLRHVELGVELLERKVAADAAAAGATWAAIGRAYGVSRQAAHKRFAGESVFPADLFDSLFEDDDEVVPALADAAKRVDDVVKNRASVSD